jgi:hypothetical protein
MQEADIDTFKTVQFCIYENNLDQLREVERKKAGGVESCHKLIHVFPSDQC